MAADDCDGSDVRRDVPSAELLGTRRFTEIEDGHFL